MALPLLLISTAPGCISQLQADITANQERLDSLEADGFPILDGFDSDSLDFAPGQGEAHNARRLVGLGVGINYLICHPARGGEELSAITPDAHARDFERGFYGGDAGRRALEAAGVRSVGMRALRDLVRAGS